MSLFPETIRAYLGGAKVQAVHLISFAFASETMRFWKGDGVLETNDQALWLGLGQFGTIAGIEQAVDGRAPEATATLSGVTPEIVHLMRDEFQAEAQGRLVQLHVQFFGVDDENDPDNQRCLDLPVPLWAGRMLRPSFTFDRGGDDSPQESTIGVTISSIFAPRSRPNHAFYTDSDQRARFPEAGDKGFEFVSSLINKDTTWPDF